MKHKKEYEDLKDDILNLCQSVEWWPDFGGNPMGNLTKWSTTIVISFT